MQGGGPADFLVREVEAGDGGLVLCGRLLQLDRVRPWVDHVEQIAAVDDLPIGDVDFGQAATDLGAKVHLIHGGELAGKLGDLRHVACQGRADRHGGARRGGNRGRRGSRPGRRPVGAARNRQQQTSKRPLAGRARPPLLVLT